MNKLFMVLAVLFALIGFTLHISFIMYDYAFHNPSSGAFVKLRDIANETIVNETWRDNTNAQADMLRQAFGIGRVVCMGLCILLFVIAVLDKPSVGE